MVRHPTITFLSDYGLEGFFVGMCHGVMIRGCPDARVIDVTHDIPRHDIQTGALALRDALPYLPDGVHLAVVDPGVGGARRAVALRTADGQFLVGPDNGLLRPGAATLGGIVEAFDVSDSPSRLLPVSSTFHGRDVFAPVAACLADGRDPATISETIEVEGLVALDLPRPSLRDGIVHATVLSVDRFGNVVLDAGASDLDQSGVRIGDHLRVETDAVTTSMRLTKTFGEVGLGEVLAFIDAQHHLSLAVNQGSAAGRLDLAPGSSLRIGAPGPTQM
jgi:S-adenosyl-L-methionine hydrolase (adenosine-forming)